MKNDQSFVWGEGGDIGWVGLDSMLFFKEFFDVSKVVIIHKKMWKK
jgi:hypothetical protein